LWGKSRSKYYLVQYGDGLYNHPAPKFVKKM
jgi:hypothetical protein